MTYIDPTTLTDAQYFAAACVVDGSHVFEPDSDRVRVGLLGDDLHPVYACPDCARSLDQLVMARPKHAVRWPV
jgi:hypothetical protein